jgi:hypothetical protein
VLGTDANHRLRHVHAQQADVDRHFRHRAGFAKPYPRKILAWRENRVRLDAPPSYPAFTVQHMERTLNFGYARAEAFARDDLKGKGNAIGESLQTSLAIW